jgi:hypothetical protein
MQSVAKFLISSAFLFPIVASGQIGYQADPEAAKVFPAIPVSMQLRHL